MLLQGRIFLSARIVGFYANLFGHKTKFFFLWEDIEDVNVVSPSWSTVGSPALVMILRKGRGVDARHGAKCQDEEGRLHFCFHSFVSFNDASRYCWGRFSGANVKKYDLYLMSHYVSIGRLEHYCVVAGQSWHCGEQGHCLRIRKNR